MAQGRDWRHRLPEYPADHKLGMVVPRGGSNCAKCHFLNDETKQDCKEKHFQQWNGGSKIPAPISTYCCDYFQTAEHAK